MHIYKVLQIYIKALLGQYLSKLTVLALHFDTYVFPDQ